VRGRITSPFGKWRPKSPKTGLPYRHQGQDIAVAKGTTVHATGAGKVTFAGVQRGYGEVVIIDHGNGNITKYAHLESINVKRGEHVTRETVVGLSGASGDATGPHLHYEELYRNKPHEPTYDPNSYRPTKS
jgi:murein DD-endopeptidase MepM/ murein hydrolase activator NlpD